MRDKCRRTHPTRAAPAAPVAAEPDSGQRGGNRARAHLAKWAFAALAVVALGAGYAAAEDGVTFAALKIALNRECNSRLHYLAYARRAEADGMTQAALAFRVAAIAESVHAALQAKCIRDFGEEPAWTVESVVVRTTEENLRTAIENEVHEYAYVYRRLVDESRAECLYNAMASLHYPRAAEATHANLFREVLKGLEPIGMPVMIAAASTTLLSSVGERAKGFYVCMGDGSVFTRPIHGSCPNCGSGRGSFRLVTPGDGAMVSTVFWN
jgi:rubrerythrin